MESFCVSQCRWLEYETVSHLRDRINPCNDKFESGCLCDSNLFAIAREVDTFVEQKQHGKPLLGERMGTRQRRMGMRNLNQTEWTDSDHEANH
jgi:hypothetical protein